MTTHILSMTYPPKIEGVFDGDIDQTIRIVASDVPWEIDCLTGKATKVEES